MWRRQSAALLVVLAAAFIAAGCGTSVNAAGASSEAHNLTLSATLPVGITDQSYNAVLNVSGGSAPYHFAVKSGTLPHGLTLNPTTGSIAGTPVSAGSYSFEVFVTDAPLLDQGVAPFMVHIGGSDSVKISVSPESATMSEGQKQQFTATVSGTVDTSVTWSASAGSIDTHGLYVAPSVSSSTNVTVSATTKSGSSRTASAFVTVEKTKAQTPTIADVILPQGHLGSLYSETLSASGGTKPYSWKVSAGAPPAGITLSSDGNLAGSPASAGTSSFTVSVKDAAGLSAQHDFLVDITSGDNFDGPAELPRLKVASAMSDTPAPGAVIAVHAGGDLQAALKNAHCGDTIELQAGATFTGTFEFPAKNCDNNHWIIVRTSSPDSALPAEGQRLTPCFAGVASLPGRPQYRCNTPQNVLAKLVIDGSENVLVAFQPGANHYRLIGLELTRPAGIKSAPTLITELRGGTASYIVLDRCWVHGTKQDDARTGIELTGMTYAAVVDSYFSDFHCTANTGVCTDAHAVSGGIGDTQDGPYEIRNNFLEASGEAVLFCGAKATATPGDITVHFNHFFKPWQWMPGHSPFQGGEGGHPFVVKNHLEFKNAIRVLAEANLMENVWGGFSQNGFGILLTPKNQHQRRTGDNVCPSCEVQDITIRYTHIFHAAGGIAMATVISLKEGGAPAKAGARWSIHDIVMDDISKKYVGLGRLFMIVNGWKQNPLNTVTIDHVTGFPDPNGGILMVGNAMTNPAMYGFVFTNSLVVTGGYPVWNSGGDDSCAASAVPLKNIDKCFTTYTFKQNALIAAPSVFPPSAWPTGNLFAPSLNSVGFVEYADADGGNYELQPGSPYKKKGSDGKDLGADIVGLNAMLANVD